MLFGVWFGVHAVAFSFGRVAHSFYVVAVAPAVVALAALGIAMVSLAWRAGGWRRVLAPIALLLQVGWAVLLQRQFPDFRAWSIPLSIGLAAGALVLLAVSWSFEKRGRRVARVSRNVAASVAIGAVLTMPAVWAASTVEQGYSGSTIGPSAGPVQAGGMGGGFGERSGARMPTRPSGIPSGVGEGAGPGGAGGENFPAPPGSGSGDTTETEAQSGSLPGGGAGGPVGGGMGGMGGGMGGQGGVDTAVAEWLQSHDPGSKYLVAIPGSQSAGPWLLAGYDVLPMGGFTGSVGFPSVDTLKGYISSGELRYVMLGGGMGGGAGRGGSSELNTWVQQNCMLVTDEAVSSAQIYDCKAS